MKTVIIDVVLGGGKSGHSETGPRRLLTATLDDHYRLRHVCREALMATPKDQWCEGMSADQIVGEMVNKALSLWTAGREGVSKTADVFLITLRPSNHKIMLRMPRAVALNVSEATCEAVAAFGD